jgi:putative ABC transport system permease protein
MLTTAGVASGVALVVSISAINSTLLSSVRSSVRYLAGDAEIEVAGADQTGLPEKVVRTVASTPGVDQAIPVMRSTTRLQTRSSGARTTVLGVTGDFPELFPGDLDGPTSLRIQGGFGVGDGIVVSRQVAESLGASIGDRIGIQTPRGLQPVRISGTVSGGVVGLLNGGDLAAMTLRAAQQTFRRTGRVDSIYVVTAPTVSVGSVVDALESRLGGAALVGPPGERGRGFERTFESIAIIISLAGIVSLFVALFVVYNTMSMAMAERRREISMTIALGAGRARVFAAYLAEAALIGTVATATGLLGGYLLASGLVGQALQSYRFLPIMAGGALEFGAGQVVLGGMSGIGVCLAGAFLPARRVLRVAPVEALRPDAPYEWARRHPGLIKSSTALLIGTVACALSLIGAVIYTQVARETWISAASVVAAVGGVSLLLPWAVPRGIGFSRPLVIRVFGTTGRLAMDGLAHNPARTSVTAGALVLTMGMVVGVGTAIGSFESQVRRSAAMWFGAPLFVDAGSCLGFTCDQPLRSSLDKELETVPGVAAAYPWRYAFVNIGGEPTAFYAIPVAEAARDGATGKLSATGGNQGALLGALESGEVVVSRFMADRRGLDVGDTLEIPTPQGARDFRVGGLFDDLLSFDSLYIEHRTYARLWRDKRAADSFAILLEPGAERDDVGTRLQEVVDSHGIDARVQTKQERIGGLMEVIGGIFSLARGIQMAALLVAALTIANTMFTAVLERRWEFGLGRALGMEATQLGRVVYVEAAVIGALGGIGAVAFGTVLGSLMLLAQAALFSMRVGFVAPWALFVLAVVGGVAVAAAAGAYPRRVATRVPVVDCLRYE